MGNELVVTGVGWYKDLVQDLTKLYFEGLLRTKWEIGKRIQEDFLKFEKPEFGNKTIENLAKDLEDSKSEVYYKLQFYNTFRDFSDVSENWTWNYICHEKLVDKEAVKQRRGARLRQRIKDLSKANKYGIVYADPSWSYYEGGYKNQSQHYKTMTIDEIKEYKIEDGRTVKEIAGENCILFMWVTFPILPEVFSVMEAWGFKYSTVGFTWVKKNKNGKGFFFGLGNWTRSNAELCLIGTKGSVERQSASISQIIYEPVQEHSRKPAIVREKIVQLVGELPRIELFARTKAKGWDASGNETTKFNE